MTTLQRAFVFFIASFCFTAAAQQVPSDLSSEEAIQAYLAYQQRPAYSAFAVSPQGYFGSSWSYGLIAEADRAAIDECEANQPHFPCYVISRDGQSTRPTVDVAELRQIMHEQRTQSWPAVEEFMVAMQAANNEEQAVAYRSYLHKKGNKAFALAFGGVWGDASGYVNAQQAEAAALAACEAKSAQPGKCQVIDTNQQAVMGRIKSSLLSNQDHAPVVVAKPESPDPRLKELAIPLFDEQWKTYSEAARNKAFAINQFGAHGLAQDHATQGVAEEAAMSACEQYNALRANMAHLRHKVAPCFLISVNNDFHERNIKRMIELTEAAQSSSIN